MQLSVLKKPNWRFYEVIRRNTSAKDNQHCLDSISFQVSLSVYPLVVSELQAPLRVPFVPPLPRDQKAPKRPGKIGLNYTQTRILSSSLMLPVFRAEAL